MLAPDTITLREAGVLGSDVELWTALAGPASLPAEIRDKLSNIMMTVLKGDEARQRLFNAGWQVTPSNADGLRMRIKYDVKTFGGIIMMRNIKADL